MWMDCVAWRPAQEGPILCLHQRQCNSSYLFRTICISGKLWSPAPVHSPAGTWLHRPAHTWSGWEKQLIKCQLPRVDPSLCTHTFAWLQVAVVMYWISGCTQVLIDLYYVLLFVVYNFFVNWMATSIQSFFQSTPKVSFQSRAQPLS